MIRIRVAIIAACSLLFLLIYFGFDTKPRSHRAVEESRAFSFETTGIENIVRDAKFRLTLDTLTIIEELEGKLTEALGEEKRSLLEQLSAIWFQSGTYSVAGHYAELIAEESQDEVSWSIAGTTFSPGIKGGFGEKERLYCFNHAVQAFENAISIDANEVAHRLNLALCYVDMPPSDNPMQGIQMLLELNSKYPENISVLLNLARLSIETGQYDRAINRLEKALSLEPENSSVVCALSRVYRAVNDNNKARQFEARCQDLIR